MSAYFVAHSTVKSPEKFQEYAQAVGPTLAPFSARLVMKGKVANVIAGEHEHTTVGIIEFPSVEKANEWYRSEAYQALIPSRDQAADMTIIIFESV